LIKIKGPNAFPGPARLGAAKNTPVADLRNPVARALRLSLRGPLYHPRQVLRRCV